MQLSSTLGARRDEGAHVVVTLKHFAITGLIFGIAPLVVVDAFIGIGLALLNDRMVFLASDSYAGALIVTVFLIAAVTLCIAVGNHFVAKRAIPLVERLNIVHSTAAFGLCVAVTIAFRFSETTEFNPSFSTFATEYPFEVLQMISLPIIQIAALPTFYYFLSIGQLSHEPA